MADLQNKAPLDRKLISLNEDWEVKYWTEALGVSSKDLQQAIRKVGNSVEKVREYIEKK